MTCRSASFEEPFLINKPQPVYVSWVSGALPDEFTGFGFTYRPNPSIESIDPDFTIIRYGRWIQGRDRSRFKGGAKAQDRAEVEAHRARTPPNARLQNHQVSGLDPEEGKGMFQEMGKGSIGWVQGRVKRR